MPLTRRHSNPRELPLVVVSAVPLAQSFGAELQRPRSVGPSPGEIDPYGALDARAPRGGVTRSFRRRSVRVEITSR